MRRFSKIAAVALVGALALTGCGSGSGSSDSGSGDKAAADACKAAKGDGPKVGLAYDVGGRGDQSFNDSAYKGMEQAIDEVAAQCTEAKAAPKENDTQRAERLRTLAEGGFNPVIGIGFIYSSAAAKVAAEYPDTKFAVIDGGIEGDVPPNLTFLGFAEEQGSYLTGMAAALKTKVKHVGFVGGTHSDLIKKFEAGYTAGVRSVDPSIKVDVQYLTEDPTDGEGGFENPTGGKDAATAMYEGGADIVYHAAGKSGLGVFDAVEAAGEGKWAIGVDSDQYLTVDEAQKPHILTSMLKRIDTAVFEYVQAFADDAVEGGYTAYDLKVDGVGYSKSGGFVDDISGQLDEAAEKIKSGEIVVPTDPAKVK